MPTNIEWCDETWNPLRGCSRVSEGCRNCYAEKVAARFAGEGFAYEGLIRNGRWNGEVRLVEDKLAEPLRWRKPRRIFVNSMSDLFHENVDDETVARIFAVMYTAHWHTFIVLTKRPERMQRLLTSVKFWMRMLGVGFEERPLRHEPLPALCVPNVYLGVSVENQETANERIPPLLQTPAAVRFLSVEPLLDEVEIFALDGPIDVVQGAPSPLDWVIVGGESGPGARPCNVAWIRSVVEQCAQVGAACFVKQMGSQPRGWCSWPHHHGHPPTWLDKEGCSVELFGRPADDLCHAADDSWWPCDPRLRDRKGGDMNEWPEDLRVREFPREDRC
jgi:protein gp37